jgi:hypothetical protein
MMTQIWIWFIDDEHDKQCILICDRFSLIYMTVSNYQQYTFSSIIYHLCWPQESEFEFSEYNPQQCIQVCEKSSMGILFWTTYPPPCQECMHQDIRFSRSNVNCDQFGWSINFYAATRKVVSLSIPSPLADRAMCITKYRKIINQKQARVVYNQPSQKSTQKFITVWQRKYC